MKSFLLTPLLLAGLGYALPQDAGCETTTTEVIVPTGTATYYSTYVTTIEASTAEDLGTYTEIERVSSTKTVATVTAPAADCTATSSPSPTSYTTASAPAAYTKRALGLNPRACTVTSTFTTTYGQTYTFLQASGTSTYTDYTAFTQATVTSTSYGGTAYAVATATASDTCPPGDTTLDSRCAPSALISAAGGKNESTYGLEYASDVPLGGGVWNTTTSDGSQCCQLCVEADQCAASAWDSKTGICKLAFPVDFETGELNCGEGFLAYYGAGPNHPLAPGSGLYVANVCGNVEFGSAQPDDGT